MTQRKGFTLIELLTVIAIIGILATIVNANLSNSRKRASDASIKGELKSARLQAEVYKEYNGGSYTGVCLDSEFSNLYHAAEQAYYGATVAPDVCYFNSTAWVAYVPLKNPQAGTTGWCVDSTEVEQATLVPPSNATSCSF